MGKEKSSPPNLRQPSSISLEKVLTILLSEGIKVKIQVKGRSMWPLICSEDTVIFKSCKANEIKFGDILLYHTPELQGKKESIKTLHRLIKIQKVHGQTRFLLKGDIFLHSDPPITPSQILGRAVAIKKKDGTIINLESWKGKTISILNLLFSPLCRIFQLLRALIWKRRKGKEPASTFSSPKSPEKEFLLLCSRTEMSPSQLLQATALLRSGIKWELLLKIAQRHKVSSLLYKSLKKLSSSTSLPHKVMKELEIVYYANLSYNLNYLKKLSDLLGKFKDSGINFIIMRGAGLGEGLYPNPSFRFLSDVDILIPPEEWRKTYQLLKNLGYTPNPLSEPEVNLTIATNFSTVPLHSNFFGKDFIVEIHTDILHLCLPMRRRQELWERAEKVSINGEEILTLSPEHTLVNLCLHLNKYGYNQLIWFCDINELIEKRDLDWGYLINFCKDEGVNFSLYFTLKRLQKLFSTPISNEVMNELKPNFLKAWLFKLIWREDNPIHWEISSRENTLSAIWLRVLYLLSFDRWREKANHIKTLAFPPREWVRIRYKLPSYYRMTWIYYLKRILRPFSLLVNTLLKNPKLL